MIIGIVAGVVLFLILIGIAIFALVAALTSNDGSAPSADSSRSNESTSDRPGEKSALTAKYSTQFDAVCEGTPIGNAAPYTTASAARIVPFYQSLGDGGNAWIATSAGYGKSYYVTVDVPVTEISVVACLAPTSDDSSPSIKCELEGGTTIDYHSIDHDVTFYEAKTAKKISDGAPISSPATTCPSFVAYNQGTNKAYALPDTKAIEATLDTFTR